MYSKIGIEKNSSVAYNKRNGAVFVRGRFMEGSSLL